MSPLSVLSRRDALRTFGASAVALATALLPMRLEADEKKREPMAPAASDPNAAPAGPFTLPKLEFAYDALEPAIDARTMQIHYEKHHQAYVNNANLALKNYPALGALGYAGILQSMNKVPGSIRLDVRNNVGGHANHTLFWDILVPGGPKAPVGGLAQAIGNEFESHSNFMRHLVEAALVRFGSGWAWLTVYNRKLRISSTANQDSPLMDGEIPVLGLDVWEHAYYLSYQNRRPEYVKAVLGLINWKRVNDRYEAALKGRTTAAG